MKQYKSQSLALILSFFFIGLGQLYNEQFWKAAVFMVSWVLSAALALFQVLAPGSDLPFSFSIFWGAVIFILWIINMIDAYQSAMIINVKIERESV